MRLLGLTLVCFVTACGGRVSETLERSSDSTQPVVEGSGGSRLLPDEPDPATTSGGGDVGGGSGGSTPDLEGVTRETVRGCDAVATLGACPDVENIEAKDISWRTSEDGSQLVVSATASGNDNRYPCVGVSPASASDDEALGYSVNANAEGASAELFAVGDDFPTPVTMSLNPKTPGSYELVVWVSRLHGACAAPVQTLSVVWN